MTATNPTLVLGVLLGWLTVGVAIADSPPGDPGDVEAAGSHERVPESMEPGSSPPGVSPHHTTRSSVQESIEAMDPSFWLRGFGSVQVKPIVPPD